MKNIALIGFMGTGKSTISHVMSRKYHLPEVDIDRYIVEKDGRQIPEIFAADGEEAFRDLESAAIEELSESDGKILSCGGGAVLRDKNVEMLKKNGVIVLLTATPETVFERVRHGKNRPVLNGNMNVSYIKELMEKRKAAYEKAADLTIVTDGKKPEDISKEIMELLEER